ncbi:Flp family type IVb pilin [Limobrevibacterium gyesilva]|uniref:Flp family type IVb pilin n=1 Tax=Limobrevibacterium gyesilva TaxID=2991712 RepID=A0AA41YN87_9PROT|nr:Flp family type IVb pilin [Limobrevibacterium gyesilva]MCW3475830.1 Flp family type IVb pilin [Limobrevibacterium gyesilva]
MFGLMMMKVQQLMQGDRRGVTALEYGLIAAVIGGVLVAAVGTLGNGLTDIFTNIGSTLTTKAGTL